jgi:hypothetical protein
MFLLDILLRLLVFGMGCALVYLTLHSAVLTFLLPRSGRSAITRYTYTYLRRLFNLRLKRMTTYAERDRLMAVYAPVSLMVLLAVWLLFILLGYTAMYWAIGVQQPGHHPLIAAFKTSGSSLLTLGVAPLDTLPAMLLGFSEAAFGLILVALLIAYVPTIYAAFSKRETAVNLLEVRAGSPPSALELIMRYRRLQRIEELPEVWRSWEVWFAELAESHTSLAMLTFFRSPRPEHCWVTAAGAVLDGAALTLAAVDTPSNVHAHLCLRAGYVSLRQIADFFAILYNPTPQPDDPISITREEFDQACAQLAAAGVPLKPDHEKAWRDFVGWRVNYDTVLLTLAHLVIAPEAPWSGERWRRRAFQPTAIPLPFTPFPESEAVAF